MHLALTDRTCCPRCGPEFGLILLAHDVRDRRVISGDLGCPNCRAQYPVRGGFADLRIPPRGPIPEPTPKESSAPPTPGETVRTGALLGVTEGPGTLLIRGPAVRFARSLFQLIGGVEIVGLDLSLSGEPEEEGLTRMSAGPRLPFFSATFQGVLLSGGVTMGEVEEAARVVSTKGRLVVLDPPRDASERIESLGFRVLIEEDGVVVGVRETAGTGPLVTLRGL